MQFIDRQGNASSDSLCSLMIKMTELISANSIHSRRLYRSAGNILDTSFQLHFIILFILLIQIADIIQLVEIIPLAKMIPLAKIIPLEVVTSFNRIVEHIQTVDVFRSFDWFEFETDAFDC